MRALVNISSVPHSLLANVSLNVLKIFLIAYLAPNTCSASISKDSDEDDCLLLDITAKLLNGLALTYFLAIFIFDPRTFVLPLWLKQYLREWKIVSWNEWMNHILNGYFQFLIKTQFIVYFECFLGTFGAFFRFAVLIILKQRIIILDTEESNSGQLDVENYNSLRQELLISATRITNFYFRPSPELLNSLWEKREYLLN